MRLKIKRRKCEPDLPVNKEQWKSLRKPASKDFTVCFVKVSKVSLSLFKFGKYYLMSNCMMR